MTAVQRSRKSTSKSASGPLSVVANALRPLVSSMQLGGRVGPRAADRRRSVESGALHRELRSNGEPGPFGSDLLKKIGHGQQHVVVAIGTSTPAREGVPLIKVVLRRDLS